MRWKPLPLPEKDCANMGVVECCDRRVCDAIGDDISHEFCHYCRYVSKTMGYKPYEFAQKLFHHLIQIDKEIKNKFPEEMKEHCKTSTRNAKK